MEKEDKIFITISIIVFLFSILILPKLWIDTQRNDWWTRVFCLLEEGEYQEKFYYDVCIIDGVKYSAYFGGTGEYHNLTKYGEIYEWQLVRKR